MFKKVAIFTAVIAIFAVGIALLGQNKAQARVCFVNDPNCNTALDVDGQDYSTNCTEYVCDVDPGDPDKPCKDTWDDDRQKWINLHGGHGDELDYWKHVKCPYSSQKFMDCPKAWRLTCPGVAYQSIYPRCGDYHDCTCPDDQYKYTHDLLGGDNENHVTTIDGTEEVLHCQATGSYCAPIKADGTEDVDNIKFSSCICSNYPYASSTTPYATPYRGASGKDYCVNSAGEEYFKGFDCDINHYPYTENQCEFGVDNSGDKCLDYTSQTWRYERCKDCSRFPATDLKYVTTDLTLNGTPTAYSCVDNESGQDCMKNNFVSAGSSFTLQTSSMTIGTATFGPYQRYWPTYMDSDFYRLWGADWPKYTYVTCPYSNGNTNYYHIVKCAEPGMRPTTADDPKLDANGDPIIENGVAVKYKAGEACIPVSCEEAVKEILKKSSFGDKYGILQEDSISATNLAVWTDGNNPALDERYHFFDGYGRPIVEQYINTRSGGFLRTVIDQFAPTVNINTLIANKDMIHHEVEVSGRIYESQANWNSSTFVYSLNSAEMNNYNKFSSATGNVGELSIGLLQGRRTAIIIGDINVVEDVGYDKQFKSKCRRRACIANVDGERQFWGTNGYDSAHDYYYNQTNSGETYTSYPLCDKTSQTGMYCSVGVCNRNPSSEYFHKRWTCVKQFTDNPLPYYEKVDPSEMILGNNVSNTASKCGDVGTFNGQKKCLTCFAKGFVYHTKHTSTYTSSDVHHNPIPCNNYDNFCNLRPFGSSTANPGGGLCHSSTQKYICITTQGNETESAYPSATNNCYGQGSEGPLGPSSTLTDNPNGTIWGEATGSCMGDFYTDNNGIPRHYNVNFGNRTVSLQPENFTECFDTSLNKYDDFNVSVRGILGAPADRYISVKEFYNDIGVLLTSNQTLKDTYQTMLERSCKINNGYVKPKITFTGSKFPADYQQIVTHKGQPQAQIGYNNGVEYDVKYNIGIDLIYKMRIEGIDIDFEDDEVYITRPMSLKDVALTGNTINLLYQQNPENSAPFVTYTTANVGSGAVQKLLSTPSMTIVSSVINVNNFSMDWGSIDEFEYCGNNNCVLAPLEIEDTNINACYFKTMNNVVLTSTNGDNLIQKKEGCATATMYIGDTFDSNGYKYILDNLRIEVGNAWGAAGQDNDDAILSTFKRAYFVGNSNNYDIAVNSSMVLMGLSAFKDVNINVSSSTIIGRNTPCTSNSDVTTRYATFVDMDNSKLTMPEDSTFEIRAKAALGKAMLDTEDETHQHIDRLNLKNNAQGATITFKYGTSNGLMSIAAAQRLRSNVQVPRHMVAMADENGICRISTEQEPTWYLHTLFYRIVTPSSYCCPSTISYRYKNGEWAYKKTAADVNSGCVIGNTLRINSGYDSDGSVSYYEFDVNATYE